MKIALAQTCLHRVVHPLQYVPDMSATDLENLIDQLCRIAVQLIEAIRVPIAALARRGLLALLGGLQVFSIGTGWTCRWDAQWPRGVRRISGESRSLAIGRPKLTIVQPHCVGKHLSNFPLPEPARIRIFYPVEHSRVEQEEVGDYLPSSSHEGIGLC